MRRPDVAGGCRWRMPRAWKPRRMPRAWKPRPANVCSGLKPARRKRPVPAQTPKRGKITRCDLAPLYSPQPNTRAAQPELRVFRIPRPVRTDPANLFALAGSAEMLGTGCSDLWSDASLRRQGGAHRVPFRGTPLRGTGSRVHGFGVQGLGGGALQVQGASAAAPQAALDSGPVIRHT